MKRKITVSTVTNGYVLTVGKDEFLYFDFESLIEGLFVRVGIGDRMPLSLEDIQKLVGYIKECPTKDNRLEKICRLEHQIEAMQNKEETLRNRVLIEHRKYYRYHEKIEKYLSDEKTALAKIKAYVGRHHSLTETLGKGFLEDEDDDEED